MTREAFFAELKAGRIGRLYLFEGEEEYTKESNLRLLRRTVLNNEFADLNESVLINPSADELIAHAETLPFLAEKRFVLVKESGWFAVGRARDGEQEGSKSDGADRLADYLENLPETLCLVFFVRGKANATRKLYKRIQKLNGVVTFDPLDQGMLIRWMQRELKGYGKQIDRRTAEQLLFAVGRDMHSLSNELAKLAAAAGDRQTVEAQDIDAVCIKTSEYKVFDLSDAVVAGRSGRALQLLQDMLKEGEQRLMLLALLQRHYRQLLFAKVYASERRPADAAARIIGVPSFVYRRLQEASARYSLEELEAACALLLDTEYLVKSGQMAEEGSLEQVVLKLLAGRQDGRV